jgi:hypothetical protein
VDAETKQILGAAILGTGGDEVVQVLLDVMYAKAPCTVVQRAMHIHPTVAESPHRLIQTGTLRVGGSHSLASDPADIGMENLKFDKEITALLVIAR